MTVRLVGPIDWGRDDDDDGNREYFIRFLVEAAWTDGPAAVSLAAGLPYPGTPWIYFNDFDFFALCKFNRKFKRHSQIKEGRRGRWWTVDCFFSTKPQKRCQDLKVEDPLLEPPKINGSSIKYSTEATHDRFGNPLVNSAFEQLRGPQVEFDQNRPSLTIEQNFPSFFQIALAYQMVDMVNLFPMWNIPSRCIKLSGVSFEELYHGFCRKYYRRRLEFDIFYKTTTRGIVSGFDRDILDEATKALHGRWASDSNDWVRQPVGGGVLNPNINGVLDENSPLNPDPRNPSHFIKVLDRKGNPMKVVLDGEGIPYNPVPAETTEDCLDCALDADATFAGTPKVWEVTGLEIDGIEVSVTLTHLAGCRWEGEIEGVGLCVMEGPVEPGPLDPDGAPWHFQVVGVGRWELPAASIFMCRHSNTFSNVDPQSNNPEVVISPVVSSNPGSIHVEKYPSINFYALRIPMIIGV